MKYSLPILAFCAMAAIPLQATAQIKITPWQIHEGPKEFTKHPTTDEATRKEAFNKVTIPLQADPEWKFVAASEIAADGTLNIARKSAIKNNKQEVDFLFFQTNVTIPNGISVKKFVVKIDQVDDGARVLLFHKDLPLQGYFDESKDIISQKSSHEIDFSSKATASGDYRVVVVQYDQHVPSNNIKGVRILVDGTEVKPPVAPPAGEASMKDQILAAAAAGNATWEGDWSWANDDNQAKNHSKLTVNSETEFVYIYGGQTHKLKGEITHSGGDPKAPLCVNLNLPNGDHLRFEWKSENEVEGQFWYKGQKETQDRRQYKTPATTAKLKRVGSK